MSPQPPDDLPPAETPPPPSEALRTKLASLAPVQTRRPMRTAVAVALFVLAYGALFVALHHLRPDLPYLPMPWVVGVAAAWFLAFALTLGLAMVPPRGQVLPDLTRAERLALALSLGLLAMSALATRSAPGHSLEPAPGRAAVTAWHCIRFSLLVAAGTLTFALVAARRVVRVGTWRFGAAIGAAGGAFGGFLLHWICPYATAAHVTIGHAGAVLVAGALGALVAPLVLER
jgi:hypothetical protein